MPPAVAEATRSSLGLLISENWRQQALENNISHFRKLAAQSDLNLMRSNTAIQPILIGDPERSLNISQQLLDRGFHVAAIRPPTVARNTARLRITLRADHTEQDIERLVEAVHKLTT